MQSKHIVIIEDDEDILFIQQKVLVQAGYRVTAMNKVQTLEALLCLDADCFLIDEQLPLVSGHIICMYLRSKPVTAGIPVVLISAHPKLDHYSELCGADAWLAKPYNIEQLLTTVTPLLG